MKKLFITLLSLALGAMAQAPVVSLKNSTTANLTADAVFQGGWEDVSLYSSVRVLATSDKASATNGLQLQWSTDSAAATTTTGTFSLPASQGRHWRIPVHGKYFRVRYTNGAVTQTAFSLQTTYEGGQAPDATAVPWSCSLDNIGATLTECRAVPGAGLKLYITDVVAQSTTTTAGLMLIRYGTGTNCGTGTTSLLPSAATVARLAYPASTAAPTNISFKTAVSAAANNAVCVIGTATNTVTIQMHGFIAP